jgi:hypothetical protein
VRDACDVLGSEKAKDERERRRREIVNDVRRSWSGDKEGFEMRTIKENKAKWAISANIRRPWALQFLPD